MRTRLWWLSLQRWLLGVVVFGTTIVEFIVSLVRDCNQHDGLGNAVPHDFNWWEDFWCFSFPYFGQDLFCSLLQVCFGNELNLLLLVQATATPKTMTLYSCSNYWNRLLLFIAGSKAILCSRVYENVDSFLSVVRVVWMNVPNAKSFKRVFWLLMYIRSSKCFNRRSYHILLRFSCYWSSLHFIQINLI